MLGSQLQRIVRVSLKLNIVLSLAGNVCAHVPDICFFTLQVRASTATPPSMALAPAGRGATRARWFHGPVPRCFTESDTTPRVSPLNTNATDSQHHLFQPPSLFPLTEPQPPSRGQILFVYRNEHTHTHKLAKREAAKSCVCTKTERIIKHEWPEERRSNQHDEWRQTFVGKTVSVWTSVELKREGEKLWSLNVKLWWISC